MPSKEDHILSTPITMQLSCLSLHTVLESAVPVNGVVFDCGANRGEFARRCRDAVDCRVYAFEADPSLASALPNQKTFKSFNYAITAMDGTLTLSRTIAGSTSTTGFLAHAFQTSGTFTVPSRSLDSLCRELGIDYIDVLKLDIEGAELEVLEQLPPERAARIRQITCEFHDFVDRNQLPRIRAVIARLRSLGFYVIPFSVWTYGDVLCVNTQLVSLSPLDKLRMQTFKIRAGIARVISRLRGRP
jgi:FkbM family methyltransferase